MSYLTCCLATRSIKPKMDAKHAAVGHAIVDNLLKFLLHVLVCERNIRQCCLGEDSMPQRLI